MRARVVYAVFLALLLGMIVVVASATSWAYGLRHSDGVEEIEVRVGGHTETLERSDERWSDYEQRALRGVWGVHAIHKEFVTPERLDHMLQRSEYVHVAFHETPPLPHYESGATFTDAYFFVSERPSNPGGPILLCTQEESVTVSCGVYATHAPFGSIEGASDLPEPERALAGAAANETAA